jgi:hypothetical protein
MSDQSNNTPASPLDESKESQIDRMLIASGAARGELPVQPRISAHPSMSVRVNPDGSSELMYHSAEDIKLAEALEAQGEGEIHDDGRDLTQELRQIKDEMARYVDECNAHRFDTETGEKLYKHNRTERERLYRHAMHLWETIEHQAEINARIQAQRDRKAAEAEAAARAEVAREQYLNEQAIRRADEMEIEKRAQAIYQKRRG